MPVKGIAMMKRGFVRACLIALALAASFPAPVRADDLAERIAALTSKLAADIAEYQRRLALFDQIQRMDVARGVLSAAEADRRLAGEARRLLKIDLATESRATLVEAHRRGFAQFAGAVRAEVQKAGSWPSGGDSAIWREMAIAELDRLAASYERGLSAGDALPALSGVAKVQGWARGGTAADPFAGEPQRIALAIPNPRVRTLVEATTRPPRDERGNIQAQPPIPPAPPPTSVDQRIEPQVIGGQPPPTRPGQFDRTGLEFDTDRPGWDYRDFDLNRDDPQVCRQACLDDPASCRAFTYAKPGAVRPRAHCWLKNPAPPPMANACCVSGLGTEVHTQPPVPPPQAPQIQGGGIRPPEPGVRMGVGFAWAGIDADAVGTWGNGNPDGNLDGHWRATIQLDRPSEVTYMAISSADAYGNPVAPHRWDSRDRRFFILAVYANGQRLNASHVPSLGIWQGTLYVDLYGSDSGRYLYQSAYQILEVGLANGQVFTALARNPGLQFLR